MGKTLDMLVSELHGKFYNQNYAGNIALLSTVAAVVTPLWVTNTAATFAIWNPAGNNRAVSMIRLVLGVTTTTAAGGQIGWGVVPNAGSAISATAPITSFTAVTPKSGKVGQLYTGNVIGCSALASLGTGIGTTYMYRWTSLSMGAVTTTAVSLWNLFEEYDGSFVVPPNNAIFIAGSIATLSGCHITAIWEEVPWP